jgi:hypothetical protein
MKTSFPSSEKLAWAATNFHNLACELAELLKLRQAVQDAEKMAKNKTNFTPSRWIALGSSG